MLQVNPQTRRAHIHKYGETLYTIVFGKRSHDIQLLLSCEKV